MENVLDEQSVVQQLRNSFGVPMKAARFSLNDFTDKQCSEQKKQIGDIERLVELAENGRGKDEWPEDIQNGFKEIRHKMQDRANTIGRQPDCLHYKMMPVKSYNSGAYAAALVDSFAKSGE